MTADPLTAKWAEVAEHQRAASRETHWKQRHEETANAAAELRTTQHAVRQIVDEVIDVWKDQIGTHYERCWVRHASCLALRIRDELDDQNAVTTTEGK